MTLLKTAVFTVVVPGTFTILIPCWLLSLQSAPLFVPSGAFRYLGVLPIVIGVSIYLRCAWDFALTGKGTPAPIDPPKELVQRGVYRYVRNPMYIGVLSVLLGEALVFGSTAILEFAVIVFVIVYLFVVFYEEPTLKRKFGESYERYCNSVPRWIPRMRVRSKSESL